MSTQVTQTAAKPTQFCITLSSESGDSIEVRLPMLFVRSGMNLATMMSQDAALVISRSGIDLSQLSKLPEDELIALLSSGEISVSTSNGDRVKLYCE